MNNPINDLNKLINNSDNSIKKMQHIFYSIAEKLMNSYIMKIGDIEFELTEIEFYYFNDEEHSDVYVHSHDLQKSTNTFLYVHQAWDNYGGIDLTFGNNEYYGGILIRGIKLKDKKYVAGPAKVRNVLVDIISRDISSYSELQQYFDDNKELITLQAKEMIQHEILHAPRHNLGKKEDKEFRHALYRFTRDDYVKAEKDRFFENSKSNLKDISMLKAISKMTLGYECNEPSTIITIENNDNLMKGIKNFKDEYRI